MIRNKILIIDDEEDFTYFTKMNLEGTGKFEVVTATDADTGIKMVRKFKPNLILLDIMMPGKNGFEVLKAVKKNKETRAIPVVLFTVKHEDSYKHKAARLYDEDYITKPVELEELIDRIEKVLKKRNGLF